MLKYRLKLQYRLLARRLLMLLAMASQMPLSSAQIPGTSSCLARTAQGPQPVRASGKNVPGAAAPGKHQLKFEPSQAHGSDLELEEAKIFDRDSIVVSKPKLKVLISINEGMNPLELDAGRSQPVNLHDALLASLDSNLDIGISGSNETIVGWNYFSSLSKFLPDLVSSYNWQYLRGHINVPINNIPTHLRFNTPFIITNAGFRYFGYQGGKVLFGALESKHKYRAAGAAKKATISDVLLDTAKHYYNLVLNEALLQIRIKAVETSQAQLKQNSDLAQDGLATALDVLQSRTQLAKDRQSLIDQQVARRNAAIQLAHTLNASMAVDLSPSSSLVRKVRLIGRDLKIGDLLKLAIDHRAELKQYEELRLAAKRAVVSASAPLQPKVQLMGNIYGIGETLGKDMVTLPPAFAPVALAGTPSPGPAIGAIPTTAFSGLSTLPAGPYSPVGAAPLPPLAVSRQLAALYTLSFRVDWSFNSLGLPDMANIQAARATARQAHLQASKELTDVIEQVRSSYLSSLSAERQIEEASEEVASSREALRLAQLRFQNGLGTNIDIIHAQRDYTAALIDKAQAIINFNIAQAQLLHDAGMISVDNLTSQVPRVY